MEAYKCDRCGKFYFPSDKTVKYAGTISEFKELSEGFEGHTLNNSHITVDGVNQIYSGKSYTESFGPDKIDYDICPSCLESFMRWFYDLDISK